MNNIKISEQCYATIKTILLDAQKRVYRSINFTMVMAYWNIGRIIVEEEQKGKNKATYGEHLIKNLSVKLMKDFGKGFSPTNIRNMRQFYQAFPIQQTVSVELSWSHYLILAKTENEQSRMFYLKEATNCNWSVRELERQISSLLYERLSLSKNKNKVLKMAEKGQVVTKPSDIVKDPYVLEFLGLKPSNGLYERDIESALIEHLKEFLLELGKGFTFVSRQQRITLDGDHFYIDLVFYNRLTKCFVLVDLKVGRITHQDIGQMQMYVNYYKLTQTKKGENDPIGIILCSDKNEAVVKFTLADKQKQIFASKYKLYLPTEKELKKEIIKERKMIEQYKK